MDCFMRILNAFAFTPVLNVGRETLPLLFLVCLHLPFHVVRDYLIWIPLQEESVSARVGTAPYFPVFLSIPSSSEVTSRNAARCGWLPRSTNVWWKLSIRAAEMGAPMWRRHKGTDATRITRNKQQKTPVIVDKTQPIFTRTHRLLLVNNSYIVSYCSVAFFLVLFYDITRREHDDMLAFIPEVTRRWRKQPDHTVECWGVMAFPICLLLPPSLLNSLHPLCFLVLSFLHFSIFNHYPYGRDKKQRKWFAHSFCQ